MIGSHLTSRINKNNNFLHKFTALWYESVYFSHTFHALPDFIAVPHLAKLSRVEVDEQLEGSQTGSLKVKKGSSKTRKTTKTSKYTSKIPAIDEQLWHVVKTIDFEHCEQNVGFQVTPSVIYLYSNEMKWKENDKTIQLSFWKI